MVFSGITAAERVKTWWISTNGLLMCLSQLAVIFGIINCVFSSSDCSEFAEVNIFTLGSNCGDDT